MLERVDPKAIHENVFSLIGDQWMLVTAGTAERCNPMTASWGGLGVLWRKNVATIYIRPQRYTFEFLEREPGFSLSFFGSEYRQELALCGSRSGRELNKLKECGFTVETGAGGVPYIAQAQLVLVCRKLYWQDFDPAHFLAEEIGEEYPNRDYHRMYIGEIVEAYRKK